MKLIELNEKGKEIPYKFKNKEEKKFYIELCWNIWGAVPCDVGWAINTNYYKQKKDEFINKGK